MPVALFSLLDWLDTSTSLSTGDPRPLLTGRQGRPSYGWQAKLPDSDPCS
ncbi:hypothetical protein [Algoriphagus ornithinivorans]|nr:hypothetical protein [Algoriphagus ornithinivorans]